MTDIRKTESSNRGMKYFRFGIAGKQPVVIVPGLSFTGVMGSADAIIQEYDVLKNDFDVYVIDARKELSKEHTVRDLTDDYARAIKKIGLERVLLFGASMGGMICQQLMIDYPDLIIGCALGATSCHPGHTVTANWAELAQTGTPEQLVQAFAESVYSPEFAAGNKELISSMAKALTPSDLDRFAILAKAAANFDCSDSLTSVKCPCRVFAGGKDCIFPPEHARLLAEKLDCNLIIYENYGHAFYDECPDFHPQLREFFLTAVNK